MKIFSGSANKELAKEIAEHLNMQLGEVTLKTFGDGETYVKIKENVRGVDAFVVQSTCKPVNNHLLELSIMIDALKRASAARITAVIPYFGYARQDRKATGREPITAKLVANLLTAAGADRVITMDLHSDQIQGFFDIPLDNLRALPIIANYFQEKRLKNVVVVSPDVGGVKRARKMASILKVPLAILDKRREKHNLVAEVNVIGNVRGKTAILVDDILDTGGTIMEAVSAILEKGAANTYIAIVHPVFSDPAIERIKKSNVNEVVVTNTIPLPKNKHISKIKILSVAPLLADVIRNIYEGKSVSELFNKRH